MSAAAARWYRRASRESRATRSPTLDRTFRKALYKLVREVSDVDDLNTRFDAFIEDVRRAPPAVRPYPDQVRDTLRGLSLRRDLALQLQRRYEDARVGAGSQTA